MPEGPAGVRRPFVKTHLKYTVEVNVPEEIWESPPKAKGTVDARVNAVQKDLISWVRDKIGDVILAVNSLRHPSKTKIVADEVNEPNINNMVPEGHVQLVWTYVVQGSGAGEGADTRTSSRNIYDLHKVLVEGDDEPISQSAAIREFDDGPLDIDWVRIHT